MANKSFRWPGASLIVIRGHKHLHECAYIGDNSSEELEEVLEALSDGTYKVPNKSDDGKSNEPLEMLRHRIDVQFHHHSRNHSTSPIMEGLDTTDITDPKQIKELLRIINVLKKEYQNDKPHLGKVDGQKKHIHRNSTIAQDEKNNVQFVHDNHSIPQKTESEEIIYETLQKLQKLGPKGELVLEKLNKQFKNEEPSQRINEEIPVSFKGRHYAKPQVKFSENIDSIRRKRDLLIGTIAEKLNEHDEEHDNAHETVNKLCSLYFCGDFLNAFILSCFV